jgi:D-alanyl-D-alanine carboxypeptidase
MKIVLAAFAAAMAQPHAVASPPILAVERTASVTQHFTQERIGAAVAPIAERALQEQGIVGFSVAIAHKGQPIYVTGFGMADRERQRPPTESTQYEIASISKMFTAVLILQLVEEGLLELDAPVASYLSDYEGPLRTAPIRSLLNHTSGFRDGPLSYTRTRTLNTQPQAASTPQEKISDPVLAQGKALWLPGSHFRYSNGGYRLLGLIIEEVTRKPFSEVVREQIFDRIGMEHSTAGKFSRRDATRYYLRGADGELVSAPSLDISYDGSGSIISTPRELLVFQSALNDGRLLTAASLKLMREPTVLGSGTESVKVPFGLATAHGPAGGRRKLGHQGTWSGSTVLAHYPDEDLTIAVLTNTDAFGAGTIHALDLESWIAHAIFRDHSPVFSPTPLPFDEEFAALLTGRFQRPSGSIWDQRWEGGELRVYIEGELAGQLLRVGPSATTFVRGGGELAPRLTEGQMSNPPYSVAESSPNGGWVFVHVGGLFYDEFRRLEPAE